MIYLDPLQSGGYTLVPFLPTSVGFFIRWHGRYLIHAAMLPLAAQSLNHNHAGVPVLERLGVRAPAYFFKAAMRHRDYVDLIVRAMTLFTDSLKADRVLLDKLAMQLADIEHAKEILRAKGYGVRGTSASAAAQMVPIAGSGRVDPKLQRPMRGIFPKVP